MRRLLMLMAAALFAAFIVVGCTSKTEGGPQEDNAGGSAVTEGDKAAPGEVPGGGDADVDATGDPKDSDGEGHTGEDDDSAKTTLATPPKDGMKLAVYKNSEGKITCPVMDVAIESESAAVGFADHNGKRYYFCCDGCPTVFEKNKSKYAK